jgi:hypothetical protein
MTTHAVPGHGCSARNAAARASLYVATVAFTMACCAFSIASSRGCPPCSTEARAAPAGAQRACRRESARDARRDCMAAAHDDFRSTLARAGIGS